EHADPERLSRLAELTAQGQGQAEGMRGIRVLIPANSLVDAAGNPPAGPVDVALATVDLGARDQMPGDYSVLVGGKLDRMDSWGAGYVEISAGGTRYNLAPGATAKVMIPIAPEQLASGGPM